MYSIRLIQRIDELKSQYPVAEVLAEDSVATEMTSKYQAILDEEVWTTSQVSKLYKLSRQNLNNISKRYMIPGRFKIGEAVFYAIEVAKPWFDEYISRNGGK